MLANNETGAIQPVAEVARIAHEAGAIVHTDAIQAAGRIPVDIAALGVDVLTLSAHKIGGPQGAGAIVRASEDLTFAPLLTGGGQEKRLRAGTENVAAIAGFGAAATAALADLDKAAVWAGWRDRLAGIVGAGRQATVFSAGAPRLPQTLCFADRRNSGRNPGDRPRPCRASRSPPARPARPARWRRATCLPPWVCRRASPSAQFGSVWGGNSAESDLDLFATAWRRVLKHVAPGEIRAA